jgi:molybdopterin synthase sulfur carrier subunit
MEISVLAFGIAREILQTSKKSWQLPEGSRVCDLKNELAAAYPELKQLASFLIAVNQVYAPDGTVLRMEDEIAIIPPVSGG